ncbi:hypothetical protein [Longimicrobium sp.]|uniref:hypothetical protein n=1 Tax=Longimicrobium sp. TaxID=2029185 RepID=UPI003B3A4D53
MRSTLARVLLGALLLFTGCMDSPVEPEGVPEGHARLALNAVASPSSATLVVEVTGPGIGEPLVFNLPVVDGVASGTVDVPLGSGRVFYARVYDAGGTETHRGQVTAAIRPGTNAVSMRLEALNGQQPIDVVIASYTIILWWTGQPIVGRPLQMRAQVKDAEGNEVPDAKVVWAVTNPTLARISPTGVLEFSAEGTSGLVAVYGGVAAKGDVEAVSATEYADDMLRWSFRSWWDAEAQPFNGAGFMLSVQSFQHSASAGNWGMYLYSEYPRTAIVNDPSHAYYGDLESAWSASYNGITMLRYAREAVGEWPDLRAEAFSEFLLGLHLGNVALLYDQGLVIDDTQDPATAQLRPYTEVMAAAIAHLDQAIAHTQQGSFTIPALWTSTPISSEQLRQLAYSFKARFRANVARNPQERQTVDWTQVIADAGNGITSDFSLVFDDQGWRFDAGYYLTAEFLSQMQYQYLGMADQSGRYQTWINLPVASRHPTLPGGQAFAIITPDNRFPQGATIEAQRSSPGRYYQAVQSPTWIRADRGTHRWSYYGDQRFRAWRDNGRTGPFPSFTREELDLLRAEGWYRTGNLAQAASQVNVTRVAAGLNATDAAGLNTSCVPRLPDGACGNLLEMLKWEFRLETQFQGMFGAPWYFLDRGWGDLYRGTQLQLPVPCSVLRGRGETCYTFGGVGGNSASLGSRYVWPFE